ncbi:MAG: hypothetical protein QM671_19780 [Bacillus sp. (in: firmicutes)]|uniref:hypothetical protein n=1 Tax=Bacillus sp. TaxID=1409 RepID=UPI0039E43519
MSQVQLQSLQDIVEQNQKMYELTNSLKLTEIQAMRIIDTKQTIQLRECFLPLLNYQNKFQNYYQVMSDSLEIKDKKIFKEGVKNLIQTLSKKQREDYNSYSKFKRISNPIIYG